MSWKMFVKVPIFFGCFEATAEVWTACCSCGCSEAQHTRRSFLLPHTLRNLVQFEIFSLKYFHLIADRLDDLVPLNGVLGGLGSLQLLDHRAAGTDPDTLFPQEAVRADRIWGVRFQKWTRCYIVSQLVWHLCQNPANLTGITGSITGFV